MTVTRRKFVVGAAALALHPHPASAGKEENLYGLIGKMNVAKGRREELIDILVEGISGMPGCLSYIVAKDASDADAIWVTEVWQSKESHAASLTLESVQQAIAKGRPLITGFGERFETIPVGGHGLPSPSGE